jgi:hypothetical protein
MPEVFADLSGTTKIDAGAAGSVAANVFTQGAANNEYAWCAGSFVWRDGRASATFKATAIAGTYALRWRINATDWVEVLQTAGVLYLQKLVAGVGTGVTNVAQALTLNNWYWLEIEKQGTTFIVKLYNTAVTTPGTTKAASTLLQTLSATVADATVQVGAHVSITSDQAAAQWGGIATGNGGVYVETWLPESWPVTFGGTLGGQAIGFDEAADSGPLSRQWAVRTYTPATSRTMSIPQHTPDGSVNASGAYTASIYAKVSGKGGAGNLLSLTMAYRTSALANVTTDLLTDGGSTSWTRKTASRSDVGATTRRASALIDINPDSTATGTAYFMLPQLEQGSAATAWRNAPADDAPIVWELTLTRLVSTTSATFISLDDRDMAANIFLPWDARIKTHFSFYWSNTGANVNQVQVSLDGTVFAITQGFGHYRELMVAGASVGGAFTKSATAAAGKHRVKVDVSTTAGTLSFDGATLIPVLVIEATRGK